MQTFAAEARHGEPRGGMHEVLADDRAADERSTSELVLAFRDDRCGLVRVSESNPNDLAKFSFTRISWDASCMVNPLRDSKTALGLITQV